MMKGVYILNPDAHNEERIPNNIVADGANLWLQQIFQAVALPGSFYIGLTGARYEFDTADLATIAIGEPVGNGYARQPLNRDNVDWGVQLVNGFYRARSKLVTWTATADWTRVWSRMFLTDQAVGTAGIVYSLSGPTQEGQITRQADVVNLQYEFWLGA